MIQYCSLLYDSHSSNNGVDVDDNVNVGIGIGIGIRVGRSEQYDGFCLDVVIIVVVGIEI